MNSTEEQDLAAGGHENRLLKLDNGKIVTASVAVRRFSKSQRQRYAYLQYKTGSQTFTKYIGKVTAPSHLQSLIIGWNMLKDKKIIDNPSSSWVVTTQEHSNPAP